MISPMTSVIYNAYRSLGVRCPLKVEDGDFDNAKQALTGLLLASLHARLGATLLASGKIQFDPVKLEQLAFAQSGEPQERAWWKQLFLEAVKNDYQFAPGRLHQLIQNGPIHWEMEWPWRFKFARAVSYLKADETVEGLVYYDQDTRCCHVVRPDQEEDLIELWSHINSGDELIAATPLRHWRAKMNHDPFALQVWVENQPNGFDLTALYLDRAGVATTTTGSGELVITGPTREKQWDSFMVARQAVATLNHGFDRNGQRLSGPAPALVAAVAAGSNGLTKMVQAAVSRTALTWETFRRQAGLEIPKGPLAR